VAFIVAASALTAVAAAVATGSEHGTHFAGFPPVGVKASTPTTGRLVIGLRPTATTEWNVYADGRIIWQKWTHSGDATVVPKGARRLDTGYVQQRLTARGVQLLRSRIQSTGKARTSAWLAKVVAHPNRWLPTTAWADPQIQAFVPSRYLVAFDRDYPAVSKLPPPAGEVLAQYKPLKDHGCQILTTDQARALLQALVKARISPSDNHARGIGFSLGLLPGQPHPSYLHFHPALPDPRC